MWLHFFVGGLLVLVTAVVIIFALRAEFLEVKFHLNKKGVREREKLPLGGEAEKLSEGGGSKYLP